MTESFDAVLAKGRALADVIADQGISGMTGKMRIDKLLSWLDSAHAAEVARLRTDLHDVIEGNIYACRRAEAAEQDARTAVGLLNTAVDVIEEGLSDRQSYDYRPRAKSCALGIKKALAGEKTL